MRLKVTGDGTDTGTRVVNAATGEPVEMVYAVRFSHEAGGVPVLTLEVLDPEIDAELAASAVVVETPAPDRPPLMIVSPFSLSSEGRRNLRESLADYARRPRPIAVLDGGVKVYQFLEGRWVPLDGGPAIDDDGQGIDRVTV